MVCVINDAILARRMDNYCEFEIIYSFMKILKVRVYDKLYLKRGILHCDAFMKCVYNFLSLQK